MKRHWTIVLLLLMTSTPLLAQGSPALPVGMQLEYGFYKGSLKLGKMERELRRGEGDHYVFESRTRPSGLIAAFYRATLLERSTFVMENGRAKPLHYLYQREGGKKARRNELVFDWEKQRVSDVADDEAWSAAIPARTVDRHLYQLNVMFDMVGSPAELEYLVADRGEVKTYHIVNLGKETVKTPLGKLDTVKLQRTSKNRTTTVWCAPAYQFLPVQIEQNEKGEVFRSVIEKISGL